MPSLARAEGRLFPNLYTEEQATSGIGDQCTAGLNFSTTRPRREILMDYKKVLQHIYSPAAYFGRVRKMALSLDRPVLNRASSAKQPVRLGPIPLRDFGAAMALGLAHCTATAQGALAFCRGVCRMRSAQSEVSRVCRNNGCIVSSPRPLLTLCNIQLG